MSQNLRAAISGDVVSTEFSNALTTAPSTGRVTVIVLDSVNTLFQDQAYGREELLKYLSKSLDEREPTALLTLKRDGNMGGNVEIDRSQARLLISKLRVLAFGNATAGNDNSGDPNGMVRTAVLAVPV